MTPRRALMGGACLAAGAGAAWLLSSGDGTAPAPEESAATARLAELRAMSETDRNTTFLAAIHSAGFLCYELADVYGGLNDWAAWTVTCADMLAYTVSVDAAGALVVEPTPKYLDGLAPGVPRDAGSSREPTRPLPR